jgi:PAS domain S-box-containing protein
MAQLESLSAHWTDPANGRRLVDLRVALIKLKEAQWWVEDVAQTPGNEPARVMFNGDIRKIHRNLAAAITPLVAIGQGRSAEDQHPSLQGALNALQVDYLRCHWALGAYVDQRAPSDRSIFDAAIKAAYGYVRAITAEREFLDREQHELFALVESELPAYESLARQAIERRTDDDLTVAQHRLANQAVPNAKLATELLTTMVSSQESLMLRDNDLLSALSKLAIAISVAMIAILTVGAWLLSFHRARQLSAPIAALAGATRRLAEGSLHDDIPVTSNDELGELTISFNQMRLSIEEAARTLNRREAQSRIIIESLPTALLMADREGRILLVNSQAESLFGYSRDELMGKPVEMLVPPRVREDHCDMRNEFFRHPKAQRMGIGRDLTGVHRDGAMIPIEVGLSPIETDDGLAVLAAIVDLQERKRAEAALARQAMEAQLLHRSVSMSAETECFEEAWQRCIDTVCELTGSPVGHAYHPGDDGSELVPTTIWFLRDDAAHAVFREVTERTSFKKGVGLPGRIWESSEPAWIVNVQTDPNFPRAQLSSDIGVKGAFGFPIRVREETVAIL